MNYKFHDFGTSMKVKLEFKTKIFSAYTHNKEQRSTFGDEPNLAISKKFLAYPDYDDQFNVEIPEKEIFPVDIEEVDDPNSCVTGDMFYLTTFSDPYLMDLDGNTYKVTSYTATSIITTPSVPPGGGPFYTAFYFITKDKKIVYDTSIVKTISYNLVKYKER